MRIFGPLRVAASVGIMASLLAAVPARAADAIDVEGWRIEPGEESCTMFAHYGPDHLLVALSYFARNQATLFVMTSSNWESIVEGKKYDTRIEFDGGKETWSGSAQGMLTDDPGTKGLAIKPGRLEFLAAFSKASGFKFYRGSDFIAAINLDGSGKAVAATIACAGRQLAKSKADPFEESNPQPEQKGVDTPPEPIRTENWIMPMDYPFAARQEGRQGRTVTKLKVGTTGKVLECKVQMSSGYKDLDDAACSVMLRSGRYRPAKNEMGEAVVSWDSHVVQWTLTEIDPAPK